MDWVLQACNSSVSILVMSFDRFQAKTWQKVILMSCRTKGIRTEPPGLASGRWRWASWCGTPRLVPAPRAGVSRPCPQALADIPDGCVWGLVGEPNGPLRRGTVRRQCEAARVNTRTGGLDLSFGFPRNGKIPHPLQVTWSQPINMLPVGNKGRAEKPAKVCTNKIALQTCNQSA